jgi:hypothetical protein
MKKFKVRYYEIEIRENCEFKVVKEQEIEASNYSYGSNGVNFYTTASGDNIAYFQEVIFVKEIN